MITIRPGSPAALLVASIAQRQPAERIELVSVKKKTGKGLSPELTCRARRPLIRSLGMQQQASM